MKDKKADIIAVARAARVSPSTVSRCFNHPNLVKATTRKKIDRAVRKLGYIRNRAAQTIHGIRSGTIGLIVPTVDHAIFAELIQSFSESVEEMGFTILLATHGYDLNREYALARKMLEHRVDGMALIGINHEDETFELLRQQGTPSILLWNHTSDSEITCVGSDNFVAGQLIAQHVVDLGHREIATVFPPLSGNDRAENRYSGVGSVLRDNGCIINEDWQLEAPYNVLDAKNAVFRLLHKGPRPSAIICGNDVLAWGALHALSLLKLNAPIDVTITGIGDFKGSKEFEPPLTTIRIPARQIGKQAAQTITTAIVEPESVIESELILPDLMVRGTSGDVRTAA